MPRLAVQDGTNCLEGVFVDPPSIVEKNAAWYTIYIAIMNYNIRLCILFSIGVGKKKGTNKTWQEISILIINGWASRPKISPLIFIGCWASIFMRLIRK